MEGQIVRTLHSISPLKQSKPVQRVMQGREAFPNSFVTRAASRCSRTVSPISSIDCLHHQGQPVQLGRQKYWSSYPIGNEPLTSWPFSCWDQMHPRVDLSRCHAISSIGLDCSIEVRVLLVESAGSHMHSMMVAHGHANPSSQRVPQRSCLAVHFCILSVPAVNILHGESPVPPQFHLLIAE